VEPQNEPLGLPEPELNIGAMLTTITTRDSPNKGDLEMAVLNLLTSMSMWFDFVSASAHVDAGSQQFENIGPYVTLDKMTATTSVKIVVSLPLSAIVMGLTLPVHSLE
jgi:hypothetical protein